MLLYGVRLMQPWFHAMMFPSGGDTMKDMQAQLEKLLVEASECALIASLATEKRKRDLFAKLAQRYGTLASEIEKAIAEAGRSQGTGHP